MPSYHRRRGYRRYGNKRRYKRKPNVRQIGYRNIGNMTLRQAAFSAMKGVNTMRGIINSEKKRYDIISTANITGNPSIGVLNNIPGGDDAMQRNGNSILCKYLRFQYRLQMNPEVNSVTTRIIVFVDTQANGVLPLPEVLLQVATTPGFIVSPLNLDYTQRFTVLFDDKIDLSNTGNQVATREHYVPLNFHTRFTSTDDTSWNKNSIFVMAMSTWGSTGAPQLTYSSRLVFYDN